MRDRIAYRRRLPHFQKADKNYLVTFVTRGRWVLPAVARDITLDEIVRQHRVLMFLHEAVVMPDHVHAVLQPLTDPSGITYPLSSILRQLKGASSRRINLALSRCGPVWQIESHDREIRTDESLMKKCEYVAQNPVRAGLVSSPDEYRWLWRWWIDDEE
jgi:REP element-mobilizing transposase RayT